jgi:hypothetical protein
MKPLSIITLLIASLAFADDKPKPAPAPSVTTEEHADMLLALAVQLNAEKQELEAKKAAQDARQQLADKQASLRMKYGVPQTCPSPQGVQENRWNFIERKWSCSAEEKKGGAK